ncbi:hypothetical protein B0A55_04878 [Friedmanniomyces simplex]|uniref:Uncharacterized protein n=1 Tax=Friedmanniomyces simplex TaxID=329884 RepID=A0A4U0XET6_9PEZI|nr:hypothetical protein B0A55_04878 [Friedmanniomyces simplex]
MEQATIRLSTRYSPETPNPNPDLAIFVTAGLLFIAASSVICSPAEELMPTFTRLTFKGLWALCAAAFSMQSQLLHRPVFAIHSALPLYLACTFAIPWLVRLIWTSIRGIPASYLAKHTILWKLYHIRNGTYELAISKLPAKYGSVVKIGQQEYSISNPAFFERCSRFEKAPPYIHSLSNHEEARSQPHRLPANLLKMANIFHYEADIEACSTKLLSTLTGYAATGKIVKMSGLLTSYAYDAMFATTTGQKPGFLDRPKDAARLKTCMENWKFLSVLGGSYLRFHPIITRALNTISAKFDPVIHIIKHLPTDLPNAKGGIIALMREASGGIYGVEDSALRAACVALVTAGTDPIIVHALTSLFHIYSDPGLLQKLRQEIVRARIDQPPKLEYLLQRKDSLPLLQAALKETLHLYQPHKIRSSFIAPEGGVWIDEKLVPEFFGSAAQHCPGQDIHYALLTKLLVQILPHVDLNMPATMSTAAKPHMSLKDLENRFKATVTIPKATNTKPLMMPLRVYAEPWAPETTTGPLMPPGFTPHQTIFGFAGLANQGHETVAKIATASYGIASTVSGNTASKPGHGTTVCGTSPTLSTASTASDAIVGSGDKKLLVRLIGRKEADELLSRFNPAHDFFGKKPFTTRSLPDSAARKEVFQALRRIYGARVEAKTDNRTNSIVIKPVGRAQQHRRQLAASGGPMHNNGGLGHFRTAEAKADFEAMVAVDAAKSAAEYHAKRGAWEIECERRIQARKDTPPPVFKEVFKCTSRTQTTNGKLGGPRKVLETTESMKGSDVPTTTAPDATDVVKPKLLPPHLRQPAADTTTEVKPKLLPPHLRQPAADATAEVKPKLLPPHLRQPAADTTTEVKPKVLPPHLRQPAADTATEVKPKVLPPHLRILAAQAARTASKTVTAPSTGKYGATTATVPANTK